MGFFDRFKRNTAPPREADITEPDGTDEIVIEGDDIADRFSRLTLVNVFATMTMGMFHFEGSPIQQPLAQLFSLAVRQKLIDELEGRTRTSGEILDQLPWTVDAPPGAFESFAELSPEKFDHTYKLLRIEYAKQGVDLEELIEALKSSMAIAGYVARTLKT